MSHFRKMPGLEARFVEVKHMALLAAPLRSSGTLAYSPPGLLARHVRSPVNTTVVVEPHRVRLHDGRRWQVIDLGAAPTLRQFVQGFVVLLKGDESLVKRQYVMTYKVIRGSKKRPVGWHLTLVPRAAPLSKVFKLLELRGSGLNVASMRTVEVDGDETRTEFTAVNPVVRFSAGRRARVFHLGAP